MRRSAAHLEDIQARSFVQYIQISAGIAVDSYAIKVGSGTVEKVAANLSESLGIEHVTLQMETETLEKNQGRQVSTL